MFTTKFSTAMLLSVLLLCVTRAKAQTPYPPIYSPVCNASYKIVIIGSSTAYGSGATPIDSSWARKFAGYIGLQNSQSSLINLGLPGYTSYHLMPTGYIPPPTRPFPVDTTHNITRALQLKPDAIILNLPSNDIGLGVPVSEVKANFDLMVAKADSANVPVWVTTTQPRNTLSPAEKAMQFELKTWIMQHYGSKALDFWTDIAMPDYTINPFYSANDGVHVNNAGHDLFFRRVVEEKIWDTICLRRNGSTPPNVLPVANAGADKLIHLPPNTTTLNGSGSSDSDGTIVSWKWRKITGPGMVFSNDAISNPSVNSLNYGVYSFELKVTDNKGGAAKDTMVLTVNNPPVADAGPDAGITLPTNSVTLSGAASTDVDGTITYGWRQISGTVVPIPLPAQVETVVTFISAGTYRFELTVTDNQGATSKDSVDITVSPLVPGGGGPVTSAPQDAREAGQLILYPNPGTDDIFMEIPEQVRGTWKLNVVNMSGQSVLQKTGIKYLIRYTDKLNIRELPKGIYFLNVRIQNKSMSSTFIKL
jgi:lysophospholipase L1-like esterase